MAKAKTDAGDTTPRKPRAKARSVDTPAARSEAAPKGPLGTFAKDFVADLPHEAGTGDYAPSVRDRWNGETFKIKDGTHEALGWSFTFAGGVFIHARRLNG